ncbi:MAG: hypothetical protein JRJ62_13195 [Deltaproteobacteria bacterium]|nr:hypothetical protein [Deltaproteobacteria bacterium]
MAFSQASIKYKPLRIGFLVREGNLEDLIKASGINCLLWGGIYNPIIPVRAGDNGFSEQLMDLFSVDLLYAVASSPEIEELVAKYPFLKDPKHLATKIFFEDWKTKKKVLGLLDSKNIIDLFWDKEYKNKPSGYKSNFLLPIWEDTDPLAKVLALQFGFFPTEPDLKWDYRKLFLKGLHAQELNISPEDEMTMSPRKSFGPIDLTGAKLRGYTTGFRFNGNGIYLGDSNNFQDLILFWNIRAAGISVVYLARDQLERSLPFAQSFVDFLNKLPNSHPSIEDPLTIYHKSENVTANAALGKQISSKKRLVWHHISELSWNGLNIQPLYHVFEWQTVTMQIEPSYGKYLVNIKLPEKKFLVNENSLDISNQQFGVIVDSYGDFGYPGHTLNLPRFRELNEFYSREIAIDPWSLRVEREGFSIIISVNDNSLNLYPISTQTLIEKYFDLVGIKAKSSQPGLIARKIIEKIGGLENSRVLKLKGVRKILQEGTSEHSITRGEATKIINENDFEKHKRLFIEPRKSPELDSNAVFNYLLKEDFFRAGLELICDHCRLKNWLSLKDIDDHWACEYCGGQNQTSTHLKNRGDWRFRKSGLFSKDNYQEGAIPVLLTLLTIKRIADHFNFSYSTALRLTGENINCESDFCVVQFNRSDEIEIGIGECKSEGGIITNDDCEKLKKAALKLSGLGENVNVYIIFAKTSDAFRPEEIKLFKDLEKEVKVIILNNKELEPYHIYWLEDGGIEEDIPEKYPHSLSDLARNSSARYLKPDNS